MVEGEMCCPQKCFPFLLSLQSLGLIAGPCLITGDYKVRMYCILAVLKLGPGYLLL